MLNLQEAIDRIDSLASDEHAVSGGTLICRDGKFGFGNTLLDPSLDFEARLCGAMKVPHNLYTRCSSTLRQQLIAEFATGEDRFSIIARNG